MEDCYRPRGVNRHSGQPRLGLPAVQQISCEKQEPRMKLEHRHGIDLVRPRRGFKAAVPRCDLLAQIRSIKFVHE